MFKDEDLGEMSVCHTAQFDWTRVPVGFDWVVISALHIVAMNIYPLKEDEIVQGMLRPLGEDDPEAQDLRILCLHTTQLGEVIDKLVDHDALPPMFSYALPTPLVVLSRPQDKQSDVTLMDDIGLDLGPVDGVGFS